MISQEVAPWGDGAYTNKKEEHTKWQEIHMPKVAMKEY